MTAAEREQITDHLERYFLTLEASGKHEPVWRVLELAQIMLDVGRDRALYRYFSTFLAELALQAKAATNGQGRKP